MTSSYRTFYPYCSKSQIEKETAASAKVFGRKWWIVIGGLEGSWPMPSGSTIEDCEYGLYIDSTTSKSSNYLFDALTFRNNKTAVALIHMLKNADLYFTNCVYEGNEVDFDNQAGNKILDEY